jgi:hypothetical protein
LGKFNAPDHPDPDPPSRTVEKGAKWQAICHIDGIDYTAILRSGAAFALARDLVTAGIPDQGASS